MGGGEEISQGLSRGARFILGFFLGLFGVTMILVAPSTDKAIYFYLFGVFCLLISVACITSGRIRQFIASLIGCALFLVSLVYVYAELTGGARFSGSRSEPSVAHAMLFLVVFGIPGLAYAVWVRFGFKRQS